MKKKIILGTSDTWSFVPTAQETSVLYCRLTDFWCLLYALLNWFELVEIWTEQHTPNTQLLSEPARKESSVPMLNSALAKELTVQIFILGQTCLPQHQKLDIFLVCLHNNTSDILAGFFFKNWAKLWKYI